MLLLCLFITFFVGSQLVTAGNEPDLIQPNGPYCWGEVFESPGPPHSFELFHWFDTNAGPEEVVHFEVEPRGVGYSTYCEYRIGIMGPDYLKCEPGTKLVYRSIVCGDKYGGYKPWIRLPERHQVRIRNYDEYPPRTRHAWPGGLRCGKYYSVSIAFECHPN